MRVEKGTRGSGTSAVARDVQLLAPHPTAGEPPGGSVSLLSHLIPLQQLVTAVPRLLGPLADLPPVRRLVTELAVGRLAGATPARGHGEMARLAPRARRVMPDDCGHLST